MHRRVWLFAPLLFSLIGTESAAQTVKIRLVNSTNGSPVTNLKSLVFGVSGKANVQPEDPQKLLDKHAAPDVRLVTDANGEAHFDLPNPAPNHFYIHAELAGPVWDCPCLVRVVTEDVLRKGLLIRNAEDERSPGKLQAPANTRRDSLSPQAIAMVGPCFVAASERLGLTLPLSTGLSIRS